MLSPHVRIVADHACNHQPLNNCNNQRITFCATMLMGSAPQNRQDLAALAPNSHQYKP